MTPEQEEKDYWRFKCLLVSVWIAMLLYLGVTILYVEACRREDMRHIQDLLDKDKCTCSQIPRQHNDQKVTIGSPPTLNDLVREVLIKQGAIDGNVRRTGIGTDNKTSTSNGANSSSDSSPIQRSSGTSNSEPTEH